jgi:hypothetical protein
VFCLLKPGGIDAANYSCPIDQNIHSSFSFIFELEIAP